MGRLLRPPSWCVVRELHLQAAVQAEAADAGQMQQHDGVQAPAPKQAVLHRCSMDTRQAYARLAQHVRHTDPVQKIC